MGERALDHDPVFASWLLMPGASTIAGMATSMQRITPPDKHHPDSVLSMRDELREAKARVTSEAEQREARDDDHFYGAWRHGGSISGGAMAKARAQKRLALERRAAKTRGSERDIHRRMVAARDGLLAEAKATEPTISPMLQSIAKSVGGEMGGYEFRLKTPSSLMRKMKADLKTGAHGASTPEAVAAGINDHLRYTIVAPGGSGRYSRAYIAARERLAKAGFTPITEPKDFWPKPNEPRKAVYKGCNAVFINRSTGQRFELQFHTPESWAAKMEKGGEAIYAKYRVERDPAVKARLWNEMQTLWESVPTPSGWPPSGFGFRYQAP